MLLSLYEHNPHSMKRTALIILHTVMVVVISNQVYTYKGNDRKSERKRICVNTSGIRKIGVKSELLLSFVLFFSQLSLRYKGIETTLKWTKSNF